MSQFQLINKLGSQREPFLFISNYKASSVEVIPLKNLKEENIRYSFNTAYTFKKHYFHLKLQPFSFSSYNQKFKQVVREIKKGNTYLLNLTQPTKIDTDLNLDQIFDIANAKYKLKYKDQFVCFSPEAFIEIYDNTIHTFPMKGTIDATLPNAKEKILNDPKEMAEHIMVVDLLRNDLSMIAENVKVKDFRYVTSIDAGDKKLLQISSHISGEVGEHWHNSLGDMLQKILPAGSITGTPKKSTVEIIEHIEKYDRGFFTGVFGIYDGDSFRSAVMIRFIEKQGNGYIYKSGGGITLDSKSEMEYNELLEKVYLP